MSHFFPEPDRPQFDATLQHEVRLAQVYSLGRQWLAANAVCMDKCNLDVTKPSLSDKETGCLR